MNDKIKSLVDRHIEELKDLVAGQEITPLDHDRIGFVLSRHLGQLNEMSDKAWETFQRIVSESRIVWQWVETERKNKHE